VSGAKIDDRCISHSLKRPYLLANGSNYYSGALEIEPVVVDT